MSNNLSSSSLVYGLPLDQVYSFKQLMIRRKAEKIAKQKMAEFVVTIIEGVESKMIINQEVRSVELLSKQNDNWKTQIVFSISPSTRLLSSIADLSIQLQTQSNNPILGGTTVDIIVRFLSQGDHELATDLLQNCHTAAADGSPNQ